MRFGPVPLAQAEGAVLAHSHAVPGGRLRKGAVLGARDLARLAQAGIAEVVAARLDPGDVGEDRAAERLAAALVPDPAGQGLTLGRATTGRVNLHAAGPGILEVDAARVAAVNAADPMLTLATLPPWAQVGPKVMVATIKVIAYAVPEAAVAAAEAVGPALRLRPPVLKSATLIETALDGVPAQKGRAAMEARLAPFGIMLTPPVTVPHREADLTRAVAEAPGELVLILTASATSDPADVGPAALVRAGGRLTRFGMPVDPGNLLFLGVLGDRPVIGLPGCARSPALNGADFVLERVVCGVDVTGADIAAMGVGGLLKETRARGRLREAKG